MLTIQNPRIDLEYSNDRLTIDGFTLVDAGLGKCKTHFLQEANTEYPYYSFYWSYGDQSRLFRIVLSRVKTWGGYYIEIHKQTGLDSYTYILNQLIHDLSDRYVLYKRMIELIQKEL